MEISGATESRGQGIDEKESSASWPEGSVQTLESYKKKQRHKKSKIVRGDTEAQTRRPRSKKEVHAVRNIVGKGIKKSERKGIRGNFQTLNTRRGVEELVASASGTKSKENQMG